MSKKSPARKSKSAKTVRKPERSKSKNQSSHREEYDNDMRGVLFRNRRKRKESQPDFTGSAEIDGVEFWISGWQNTSKQGVKFMSLAFNVKQDDESEEVEEDDDEVDDLPF